MRRHTAILLAPLLLAACDQVLTADQRQRQQTEQVASQITVQLGIPAITNFTEKRNLKMLYELRDSASLVTYAYYLDLQGNRHKICPTTAVGYGLPYATQYTNPIRIAQGSETPATGNITLPQPEPNGLFMPSAAEGTWIICLAPDGKSLAPVYVEPRVIVSPFELSSVN